MQIRSFRRGLVVFLLISIFVLPSIPATSQLFVRPEELLALLFLPVGIALIDRHLNRIDVFFLLIGFVSLFSLFCGSVYGIPFEYRDVMEQVKLIKYWLFFRIALYDWTSNDRRVFIRWFLVGLTFSALVGLEQWINLIGIGDTLKNIYGYRSPHLDSPRLIGTMKNPNDYGLLLMTGFAFVCGSWHWYKKKYALIALGVLLLGVIALTSSRSAITGIVVVLAIVLGFNYWYWSKSFSLKRRVAKIIVFVILVGSISSTLGYLVFKEIQSLQSLNYKQISEYSMKSPLHIIVFRFAVSTNIDAIEGQEKSSLAVRGENWKNHWGEFLKSPIFGLGPGKSTYSRVVDSEYVLYLRQYGLLGLLMLLALYKNILGFCAKALRTYSYLSIDWGICVSILSVLITYLIVNFFLTTFYLLQLMSLFWLLVGIGFSSIYFKKSLSCSINSTRI